MGYLGQEASFTGTQNNKRLSVVATAGQVGFLPNGGYSINAIDVYRNGVKLVGQRDFTALDGVTVTLTQAANVNDVIEFVIFENFAVNDVVSTDGDSVIRGSIQINGNLTVVDGVLDATVTNTATAGFAQTAGISSALGIGATAVGLNASGIITAISFSGSGATFSGFSTFSAIRLGDGTDGNTNNIKFGADNDLGIYHNGSHAFLENSTGNVYLRSNAGSSINIEPAAGYSGIIANAGADVELYYNNSKKLETDVAGVIITGIATADGFRAGDDEKIVLGSGDDLEIYHNGTLSYIDSKGTQLRIESDAIRLRSDGGETYFEADVNGAAKVYYDNSTKLTTKSDGIDVTGELQCDSLDVDGTTAFADDVSFDGTSYGARWDKSENQLEIDDNAKIVFGNSSDLQIYHDGSNSIIKDNGTGKLIIDTDGAAIEFQKQGLETIATFNSDGSVELYHDNSKKLETSATGVTVTGTLNATTDVTINGKGAATTGKAIAMAMVFG